MNIVLEISREILNDIFAEFDGNSKIKNITDMLSRWTASRRYFSNIYSRECKEIYNNQVNQVLSSSFFSAFSENWGGRGDIYNFLTADHAWLLLGKFKR